MSKPLTSRVLGAIARKGPMTNRSLQDELTAHGGEIARACAQLRKMGLIDRIDGQSGRGRPAVYARSA